MGKTHVNGTPIVTTGPTASVAELKQLADIPDHEKLYNKEGKVLADTAIVPTEHNAEYGAVTDWERGAGRPA